MLAAGMPREDRFKQIYLALIVTLIGIKWLLVPFILLERLADAELHVGAELRIIVPTAALLLGAARVARTGTLRTGHGCALAAALLAVLALGGALTIVDNLGPAALLRPDRALAALPPVVVLLAGLWLVKVVGAWLLGAWIVGLLFWPRPGLDDLSPPARGASVDPDGE